MSTNERSCPSCGARVSPDADRCDLCGAAVESVSEEEADASEDASSLDSAQSEEASTSSSEATHSVFCHQCGWKNPPEANYCSKCGAELQDLDAEPPEGARPVAADLPTGSDSAGERQAAPDQPTDEQEEMGRQVALLVGGAVVLVLVLFFLTQWSEGYEWSQESSDPPAAAQAPASPDGPSAGNETPSQQRPGAAPGAEGAETPADLEELVKQTSGELNSEFAGQVDSLREQIAEASNGEKQQLQSELVNLLIGAGEPGRAAVLQKKVADATGAVDDRRRAADLLYRWMQQLQEEGQRQQIFEVARHAANAYEAVAEERPDDLDARTRMGEAYLLTNDPMQGIKTINAVLDDDSTFVPARFQKGLALLQINRFDQARKEFEKVMRDAGEESAFYRQAERAVEVIDEQGGSTDQQSSLPEGG